ncbi:L-glutaminase [Aequorivita sublithincola DSM 14238]|uniref:Glutaminase n=1 Tax=Aequorivita sublithincola (strain DSM 14238 / LMG 21431 / ACAM 643 / 9-3) TaxID=746697 RepID=I3YXD2_AEQSU|nr:glutaminase [Aequorivita sublithincola]AFL81650.1 L-glutaminase [Aequorivita sublithincola DSM 14238]
MLDYQAILEEIHSSLKKVDNTGEVANYIPELGNVSKDKFGIHLQLITGESHSVGDASEKFSIQSISKVLSLAKAFQLVGNDLWERVDVEPSGNPFNHLSLLELENGIPRNPLINSGAIVIADVLLSHLKNPKEDFLNFVKELTHDDSISYNNKIAESERITGFNNYAAANLLKAYGNLNNEVEDVLDFYFHQCSIMMDCKQLTNAFFVFANKGACLKNVQHLTASQVKRINAIMLTCGFYDEAGEFAFEVGLPGKSGVGGGIVALLPHCFTIATWAPALNPKGNPYLGMQALEQFTTRTKLSIF